MKTAVTTIIMPLCRRLGGTMLAMFLAWPAIAADCLYVSSYHAGYHWNDAVEEGLQEALAESCELHRFYMDTKRHKEPAHAAARAREAMDLIARLEPQVVIACDDNASRYLVAPYLRDGDVPVVFCGVNWTVEPYGYPYPNATGMVEVAPIGPLLRELRELLPAAERLVFLSADVPTQHKEAARLRSEAARQGMRLEVLLVDAFQGWLDGFDTAQDIGEVVVLGNPIGIAGWDADAAWKKVAHSTRRLTASFGVYMKRYAALTMSNVPREQGEWAGEAARLILDGESPANIPIVCNGRWELYVQPKLAARAGVELPESLLQRALRVEP